MFRVTDHTRTEKIGGDSIVCFVVFQVVAGNRYDKGNYQNLFLNWLSSTSVPSSKKVFLRDQKEDVYHPDLEL